MCRFVANEHDLGVMDTYARPFPIFRHIRVPKFYFTPLKTCSLATKYKMLHKLRYFQ